MSDVKEPARAKSKEPVAPKSKAAPKAKEPAAQNKADEGKLTCYKGTIKVGTTVYRRGDKVTKAQVNKLPKRLHRWFKSAP